jgi:hypothetical protein
MHQGEPICASINLKKRTCTVTYNNYAYVKTEFEYLVSDQVKWISSSGSLEPPNAIKTGWTPSGDVLYVGRVGFENQLIPGKIHVANNAIFVGVGEKEKWFRNYEILVLDPSGDFLGFLRRVCLVICSHFSQGKET